MGGRERIFKSSFSLSIFKYNTLYSRLAPYSFKKGHVLHNIRKNNGE